MRGVKHYAKVPTSKPHKEREYSHCTRSLWALILYVPVFSSTAILHHIPPLDFQLQEFQSNGGENDLFIELGSLPVASTRLTRTPEPRYVGPYTLGFVEMKFLLDTFFHAWFVVAAFSADAR